MRISGFNQMGVGICKQLFEEMLERNREITDNEGRVILKFQKLKARPKRVSKENVHFFSFFSGIAHLKFDNLQNHILFE